MPKQAAPLECSAEVRAELTTLSRSRAQEARMVERARIVLACLEGKEIQQVAHELGTSIPTVASGGGGSHETELVDSTTGHARASRRHTTPRFATGY
jgi:hypothetical protein